jgi:three-Cys-motif partner protein
MQNADSQQNFGSTWTEIKLDALRQYLVAYRKIFSANPRARHFTTWYVDAFAGSGARYDAASATTGETDLFADDERAADSDYRKGSASVALELPDPFDQYYFIDKKASNVDALKSRIASSYPSLKERCNVQQGDATSILNVFLAGFNSNNQDRAVVFLDPFGMEVGWNLIQKLAETKAIDLWLLFPHGIGVNRLLTANKLPPPAWRDKLTNTFGTSEWEERFYSESKQMSIADVDEAVQVVKTASFTAISAFMVERLGTIFAGVCKKPIVLANSRGAPLYSLCFAVSNPNGKNAALKIAEWISQSKQLSAK